MQKNSIKQNYLEYVDIIRVVSMLAVVYLHTVAGSLRVNLDSVTWHVSNSTTALLSTCVPLFFMISGAMLMRSNKTVSIEITFKDRLPKLVIPFIMWSLISIAFFGLINGNLLDIKAMVKQVLYLPNQAAAVHLWFMYALIPLYILSPIFKKLVDALSTELIKYMLILWFITNSLLPTIVSFAPEKLKPVFTFYPTFNMIFLGGYLGYFLLGYYLMTYNKDISKKLLLAIIVIDGAIVSLGTWYKTMALGEYTEMFKGYTTVFQVILSAAIFLLIKEYFKNRTLRPMSSNIITVLASLSFGIYLLHNLVIVCISKFIHLWPAASLLHLMSAFVAITAITIFTCILLASCRLTCYPLLGISYEEANKTCNFQHLWRKRSSTKKQHSV